MEGIDQGKSVAAQSDESDKGVSGTRSGTKRCSLYTVLGRTVWVVLLGRSVGSHWWVILLGRTGGSRKSLANTGLLHAQTQQI